MGDALITLYPWIKALHLIAVISWMAGIFYVPRLFVHHVERAGENAEMAQTFVMMEEKLMRIIMGPAMMVTWVAGLLMVAMGTIDWSAVWPWVKAACVIGMTWFHIWCSARRKELAAGTNTRSGKTFRMMNEVPTVLMIVIVVSVVVRPF